MVNSLNQTDDSRAPRVNGASPQSRGSFYYVQGILANEALSATKPICFATASAALEVTPSSKEPDDNPRAENRRIMWVRHHNSCSSANDLDCAAP